MDNLTHKPTVPYAIVDDIEHDREEGPMPIRALVKYRQSVHAIGKPWCPERIAIIEAEEDFILRACNALAQAEVNHK